MVAQALVSHDNVASPHLSTASYSDSTLILSAALSAICALLVCAVVANIIAKSRRNHTREVHEESFNDDVTERRRRNDIPTLSARTS